ncbi:MAG TPA: hypothetical protein VF406_21325 [Thermodesulfobacteriota bacterium]
MARKFKREPVATPEAAAPPAAPACPGCRGPLDAHQRCAACRLWVGRAPLRFCPTVHGKPTVDADGGCWICRDFPLPKLRHEWRGAAGVWVETSRREVYPHPEEVRLLLDETFGPGWREHADAVAARVRAGQAAQRAWTESRSREPGEEG